MLACIFYMSTSTLTLELLLHNNNTTTSNRLFTHVCRRTIAHTKELLNTLGAHTRSSNQLSWPNGGKKIAFTGFPWGGISPPWLLYRVFNSHRCATSISTVIEDLLGGFFFAD